MSDDDDFEGMEEYFEQEQEEEDGDKQENKEKDFDGCSNEHSSDENSHSGGSPHESSYEQTVNVSFLSGCMTKSGLPKEGLDRTKIDEIIQEASKNSKFYQHQLKREQRVIERIDQLRRRKEELMEGDMGVLKKAEFEVRQWMAQMESHRDLSRTIVHIDMDAFFAAVETLYRPELAEIPMAVGSESMLSTANYVARKFGVVSAMPGYIARKLCPQLTIIPHNSERYRESSKKVHNVLILYDPRPSSFSLDEASLDLTDYIKRHNVQNVELLVERIRREIYESSGLTCSAGVAVNRQLAKMCSNLNKPNGQFVLTADPNAIHEFITKQPINRINGVGKVASKILKDLLQIHTCQDLLKQALWIRLLFSETQASFFLRSAMGIGAGPSNLEEEEEGWERKSISVERTFKTINKLADMQNILKELCHELAADLLKAGLAGRCVGIKMKTSEFNVFTRATTLPMCVWREEELYHHASDLLSKNQPADLRLLGVRLASILSRQDSEAKRYQRIDQFLSSRTEPPTISTARPECPLCARPIDAHPADHLRINEHIDRCLKLSMDNALTDDTEKTIPSRDKTAAEKFFCPRKRYKK